MTIDTLTIAGFISAASFMLMPMLMKREFIRVESDPSGVPSARPYSRGPINHQPALDPRSIPTI